MRQTMKKYNQKESIEKVVNITYNKSNKQLAHPVYPNNEDLAQNCLTNWVARGYKNPSTTTKYTLLINYNRQTKPEFNKSYKEVELDDFHRELSVSNENKLFQDMYLKDFFEWLPEGRPKDMFYRNIFLDEKLSSIAISYGLSRQALHVAKTKIIEQYKIDKGIRK